MKCYNYANWTYVSIHASVKDATASLFFSSSGCCVSIHASVKDATQAVSAGALVWGFNPRICKRCDR